MSHRNFFDNDSPAEISETTTHRQKFLRQGSTEISGTTVQRNFWDNDPQKFLGRLERINFWGPLMRSRLYFQFALRFQFPSANEKKNSFLRQFTARSSWYVIENKARQGASFIFVLYSTIFFFLLYRSGRVCLSPNTPKKLMMPLVYYHLKHASIKQTKKKNRYQWQ